eukprot:4620967-Pyramimonas_sp.AAC.1
MDYNRDYFYSDTHDAPLFQRPQTRHGTSSSGHMYGRQHRITAARPRDYRRHTRSRKTHHQSALR